MLQKYKAKHTHGGARPGSGWRDREKRYFRYQTRLRRDQIKKLKSEENAAAVVRTALDAHYAKLLTTSD